MATNNNPFMPAPGGTSMPGMAPSTPNTSDTFEVDLSDVQESQYTIPDGLYKVKCMDIEQSVSKGGNPMFVWDFAVQGGQYDGFTLKMFTAITPAAMWKVAETVQALGVGQTGQVVKFKRTDVIGKICGALVESSEYNGNMRSSISKVMTLKEMEEAKA
jgi:hypothetical protein